MRNKTLLRYKKTNVTRNDVRHARFLYMQVLGYKILDRLVGQILVSELFFIFIRQSKW